MKEFLLDFPEEFLIKLLTEESLADYYKIGFHNGPAGNRTGIGDYWKKLDSAGIPTINISVDDYGPCYELDELAKVSGIQHVNLYRIHRKIPDFNPDVPLYNTPPELAGAIWWDLVRPDIPPEMLAGSARERVWLVAGNEVDKSHADWLGYWALNVAQRANAEGFKIAAFGWSSGEPDYDDWTTPGMEAYLRYCSEGKAAIATHEYSYTMNLEDGIGYLIGRFNYIKDACYQLGINVPDIFVSEFGWTYQDIPSPATAMAQMYSIAKLYAAHPEVKGAMLWYLGGGFDNIADQVQKLIPLVTEASLAWGYSPGPVTPPPAGGTMTDLADFFRPELSSGDGTPKAYGPIYMLSNNWGQGPERTHLSKSPKGSANHFYVSKNSRWERRYIGDVWIWLQADTSRADDEFYTVDGDPWLPRYMKPGDRYTRNERVNIYSLGTCEWNDSGGMTSDIYFVGKDLPMSNELGVEVIELNWIVGGEVEEKYFYAKHVGLVAWENKRGMKSKIDHFVPSGEVPNSIEWNCTQLNEAAPLHIPPPPENDIKELAWNATVEMQVSSIGGIRLNKDAGIQQKINEHNKAGLNLQVVTDEIIIEGTTFLAAESLTGACPRRVYAWRPGQAIYYFEKPG